MINYKTELALIKLRIKKDNYNLIKFVKHKHLYILVFESNCKIGGLIPDFNHQVYDPSKGELLDYGVTSYDMEVGITYLKDLLDIVISMNKIVYV
jgi:hypothetical protein